MVIAMREKEEESTYLHDVKRSDSGEGGSGSEVVAEAAVGVEYQYLLLSWDMCGA